MISARPDHLIALCSAAPAAAVALCASVEFAGDGVPDWVHLLPAGEIRTGDGRGPYRIADMAALCAASLAQGEKLVLDENHATDLAAPRGESAPARGWIVELQARQDGVWGKIEWTAIGRRLVGSRAYRGISPVITHLRDGTVTGLLRASLVNKPNLRGLTALHSSSPFQENQMDLLAKLLAALGLPATTSEETLLTAVTAMHAQQAKASTALQAALDQALGPIGVAVGLQAGADATAILAGVQQLKAGGDSATIIALQAEITSLGTALKTLQDSSARKAAESFVDGAIKAGTVGVKPLRDRYVAMHMEKPADTESLINALPKLGPSGAAIVPPAPANGEIALQAEDSAVAKLLGIAPKAMAETIKGEREAAL